MHLEKNIGQRVVLFEPDLTETTTIARAQEFIDAGLLPVVFGFRRARYNRRYVAPWREIELGRTRDARYWDRLRAMIAALPAIIKHRSLLVSSGLYLARNLDQLLLALLARALFNRRAAVVYEVVDIQPAFTRDNLGCAAIRWIERLCLARTQLIVVSSPAFFHNYFAPVQRYRGEWVVVENKLRLSGFDLKRVAEQRARTTKRLRGGKPWIVGYFGLIRGQATIELIVKLAKRFPETLQFKFGGVLTTVDEAWFRAAIAQAGNIRYDGEFENPGDLTELYSSVDFVWAIDLENIESNSRWLLPCRFYEAGLFGVPCLAVRRFEIGQLIERLDVGWTFDKPLEDSLSRFFESLTTLSYEAKAEKLKTCPIGTFVAGDDGDVLCQKLRQLGWLRPAFQSRVATDRGFARDDALAVELTERN